MRGSKRGAAKPTPPEVIAKIPGAGPAKLRGPETTTTGYRLCSVVRVRIIDFAPG